METNEKQPVDLPENAFRELKPGEEYKPILSPEKVYPEVNAWSVSWGIVMAVIFSAAAAFLGLKVGQVFEAAIPIAIIAVGLSGAAKRKNALGSDFPLHIAHKKISHLNEAGELVKPEEPNGYKFETLVLDMVHMQDSCLAFEVDRSKEFAPVKNAVGVDSVETARALLEQNGVVL